MESKTTAILAGSALAAAVAITGAALLAGGAITVDPDPKDVKTVAAAQDAGEAPDFAVYKTLRSDGGTAFYGLSATGKVTFVDGSPCRRKRAKAAPGSCTMKLADGGERDLGDGNTIQPGRWADHGGCEETACAVFYGDAP